MVWIVWMTFSNPCTSTLVSCISTIGKGFDMTWNKYCTWTTTKRVSCHLELGVWSREMSEDEYEISNFLGHPKTIESFLELALHSLSS
jgi:hypothetical protein